MPHFLAMMVRAPRAVVSGGEFTGATPSGPQVAAKGPRVAVKARLPTSAANEQMANSEFATRSTARGARTIMARK